MYYSLRYDRKERQLVGLLFTKCVVWLVAKILDKYTDKEFLKILFLKLKFEIWGYWQVTTDAFTFPKEILTRNTSLFWVLAVSKEMK